MKSLLLALPDLAKDKQDKIETMVETTLIKHSVNTHPQNMTSRIYEYMRKFSNRAITKTELELMIQEFGEKTVILYVFNSDRGSYFDVLKSFKDEEYEKELIKQGLHPLYVTEEDAKALHSEQLIGTHAPVISTHFGRMGSPHGKESLFNNGLIYELYKKGVMIELTPEAIMEYVFLNYNRHLPKPQAVKIAIDINKQRIIFEGSMFTGKVGDDQLTQKALEKVTAYCKKNNMSFQKSNEMGKRARVLTKQVENVLGNEIGNLIVKEEDIGTAEVIAKAMAKLCSSLNTPIEDVGALMTRPLRSK